MIEIWRHGVGSSCKGNEYHHEIDHAVERGVTLCGVEVRGKDWRIAHGTYSLMIDDKPVKKYQWDGLYDCQRCAKAMRRG